MLRCGNQGVAHTRTFTFDCYLCDGNCSAGQGAGIGILYHRIDVANLGRNCTASQDFGDVPNRLFGIRSSCLSDNILHHHTPH